MPLLLLYPKTLGTGCSQIKSHSLLSRFPLMYHRFSHQSKPPKNLNHYVHTYHVVIMIVIVIIALLTSCYSIISHVTLILFYHASILTLQNSLISHALWWPQACSYGAEGVHA